MFQSQENQRWTALIQSCFSLKQRCSALKQRWIFQFWTALIQRKSELISAETELISADFFHVLWISAEKRQNYETALLSADYLWDFNPGETLFPRVLFSLKVSKRQNFSFDSLCVYSERGNLNSKYQKYHNFIFQEFFRDVAIKLLLVRKNVLECLLNIGTIVM